MDNFNDDEEMRIRYLVRKGEKMSNNDRQKVIKNIFATHTNPGKEITTRFPKFVSKELAEHNKEMQRNPRVSPMIRINYGKGGKRKTNKRKLNKKKQTKKRKTLKKNKKSKRKTRRSRK